jgi:flagellar biosynthesis GTPase FlhF
LIMDKSIRAKRNMLEQHSEKIAEEGRGEDEVIGHLTKGEIVIPKAFMEDERIAAAVQQIFAAADVNINQYTVGHDENSINPTTGNPEFFSFKRFIGTIAGATLGFVVGGPSGAVQGAKIGAGVDVARATYSAAETAERESQAARAQAATESAAAVSAMESQAAAQREQAVVARQRLEAETARAAEEKLKLEEEAKRRTEELEAAQREMSERESSRLRASRRSGRRSLLSQQRLSPELGLNSGGTSLSPTVQTTRMM